MKLRTVIMRNFRAYRQETRIPISGLTAFVGRNDIGKSTVLEALEIFFNNSSPKMDEKDGSISGDAKDVMIGCEFSDLPDEVVLDATASTSLRGEFLLNPTGLLEIHKVFDCTVKTPKDSVFAFAAHPTEELLSLKNSDLKKKTKELKINLSDVDERSNPQLRRAIWAALGPGDLSPRTIQIDKGEDAKSIWEGIKREFPIFALFRSDRPSRDEDDEVQDPMRLAIIEALREVQPQLDEIKQSIRNKATEVAQRTLAKLREMDQDLAGELAPNFKAEPKWDSLFKMALSGDDQIPVNKRGSGVRRLILINFFRAEAERS